ncbi:MAG: efflux RND transporter permease subunit [Bacteroidetes bacterium]|nr:efflux RND transporter permease subunit [Bacteroidota bacterium]
MKQNFLQRYRSPILFGGIILLLGGVFAYLSIQVSLFPEITFPKIKVIADNGDQPVDKMMIEVTRPLEDAIKQIPDLLDIRSTTSRGSTEMSVFLDWKSDIYTSQQLIESRIAQIRNDLPSNTQISVERMNPATLPVMGFSLESKSMSLMELKLLAEYTIKPYLSQVAGVSAVNVQGGKTKEYRIEPDPAKLVSFGLTPTDISNAMAASGFIKSNGYINSYRRLYLTITDAGLYSEDDIANIPLNSGGGGIIRVKDVARVRVADKVEYIKINANGHEGVLVNILRQPNANLIAMTKGVQEKISEMKNILPADVQLKPYYVQSEFVNHSIKSIRDALLIGLLLAIFVVIIFLRSMQSSISILFIIPVTLATSLLVMRGLNYTLNIMTIGAIAAAIGLIIDDAVIVIEQIHRSREEEPDKGIFEITGKAIRYLFPAMVSSSLSTIVIFLPFSLMSGVAGAYFKIMAFTMIITLACSFAVTALILPVLYASVARVIPTRIKPVHHDEKKRWIDFFIRHAWISLLLVGLLAGMGIFTLPKLQTGFLPEMDEGSIVLDFDSPPGTSIEETEHMLTTVDSIILNIPEVVSYSRRTGTQMGFFITEPSRGDYLIKLSDKRKRSTNAVIAEIRQKVENQLPMLIIDFGQVIGDMLGDLMASVQPIEIKVFGPDREKLKSYSEQIAKLIEKVLGTADVFNGLVIAGPNITLRPDETALARFGMKPADLQYQLKKAIEGKVVGAVKDPNQMTPVRMIYPGGPAMNIDELRKTRIFLPAGLTVPLTDLTSINVHSGVAEQERENLQPIVAVTSRLEGRDLGSVMTDIRKTINEHMNFPKGYGVRYGGAYAEQQQSFRDLLIILILASLMVLFVVMIFFRDPWVALLILGLAITGIGGSVVALYLTHTPLNVGSYMGIIMIVGIIAENAIFTYQQYLTALKTQDRKGALNHAIAARLRPKLMTAIAAITALMPLALGIGTGAQMHQPLAIAVIGGFLAALPLLLIVFPGMIKLFRIGKINGKSRLF